MKTKDVLSQKVAAQNLDRQLQKLAADLTLDYLADSFEEVYSAIYNQLKKVAAEIPKESKKKKLLALLGAITGIGVGMSLEEPILKRTLPDTRVLKGLGNPNDIRVLYKHPNSPYIGIEWDTVGYFESPNPDILEANTQIAERLSEQLLKRHFGPAQGSNMYHPIDQIDLSSLTE